MHGRGERVGWMLARRRGGVSAMRTWPAALLVPPGVADSLVVGVRHVALVRTVAAVTVLARRAGPVGVGSV